MIHPLAAYMVGAKYQTFWACLITVWLWSIILNLFLVLEPYGVALANLGLALGILAWIHLRNRTQNNVLAAAYLIAKRSH